MSNLLKISMEKLLERTDNDVTDVTQSITDAYSLAGCLDASDVKDAILLNLAHAFTVLSEWQKYYHHFNEIVVNINNNSDELIDTNAKLAKKVEEQSILISQLQTKLSIANELINQKNNSSNMVQVDLVEMINTLDGAVQSINDIVGLVDENVKSIALSHKLKTTPRVNMHGEEHPRYRNDIDNNSLIADYKSGMILKDLSEKYHISIPGIRNRLMDLGVYKQVYKKN